MKTVLITGCSSGFGLEIASYFLQRDWQVIATMRTPRSDLLPASPNLRILPLDVTSAASIASDIEDTYRENPHELSVVDHPAWHKLRTQPGVAAPGTLSYLPSLPQKAGLTSDDADLDAMSDAHQPSLASPQRPEFSHPFQQDASSPSFAASAHANGDAARASARVP